MLLLLYLLWGYLNVSMDSNSFLTFWEQLLTGFMNLGNWLTNPIFQLGDIKVSPLVLVTATGLIAFIGVAFVKWLID